METLEKISGMSQAEAKAVLIRDIEEEARHEAAIMVKPEVVNDDGMILVVKDIVKKIEPELEYPG